VLTCAHACVCVSGAHSRGWTEVDLRWECRKVGACAWSVCQGRCRGWIDWGLWGAGAPCPGLRLGTAGSAARHGTARRGVCSYTPPMSAPACSPAPRQAGSRCSGQSKPAPGQLSMLGGRLLPLPKSGRSFPQDGVSQQYGDNGKTLRQHSWQPSARCYVSAAPLFGREEKYRPLAGVRAKPAQWVGSRNRMGFGKETKTRPGWATDD